MAPKDPLLGTLKVCILNLQSFGEIVTDSNPHLASCCELLELVLRKGLHQPVLSLVHRDYWQCFEQLPQQDTCGRLCAVSLAVEQTKVCRKLLTAQGRGRYLLRLALSRKTLQQFITHLLHTPRIIEWYSPAVSILRSEEFVEPFISLLRVLSQMEFKPNMENCSFLDESWLLPVCEMYETVPCRELGMVLRYISGRVFVLELLPGSQAQADKFICPGDVIDEINGVSLRNSRTGQPASEDKRPSPSQCLIEGRIVYIVQFLGKANIGMCGSTEVLQHAIPQVLQKNLPIKEVLLDMKETHLTCIEKNSKTELFQHHYPEISCVGRYGQPDYTIFAFCVVDYPETPHSTGFCCVALRAGNVHECKEIICRIATGFKHTELFV
ncbi:uncharacterized protein si:ch211-250n8.1 isoform X3 [Lampris incognitus]|uniref:uncharacterized protein si:ch211-250n8.1 isoform X3 n=1 Tax=Lampris incognitus TaxID=2546036 RepID=UPI0024B55109|nr:uncharacterized protein si:ch211-250n8.1 isoform X3 [Lampris incognitus]